MSISKLNDTNTQVNVSNSILRHFSCNTFHPSYAPLDNVLDHVGNKKICLILFDGFGKYIQKTTKSLCPFLYDHGKFDIETVYPPTTVAATTSILTGKYPIETGFLGWTQYWKRTNEYINTFSGIREGSDIPASIKPTEILHYTSILDIINEKLGQNSAIQIMGFDCKNSNGDMSSGLFFNKIEETLKEEATKFIYAYWPEPDHSLHGTGIYSKETKQAITIIEESLKLLVERNPDIIFLTIADHGHTPVKWLDIRKYPRFMESLVDGRFSIEPRCASFLVKPNMTGVFEEEYKENFSKWFEMFTKKEVYDYHIFGYGTPHQLFDELLGDYLLVATDKYSFYDGYNFDGLIWTHAGATKEERIVELGVFNEDK